MYVPSVEAATGRLAGLRLVLLRSARLALARADRDDARWLAGVLCREGAPLGTRVELARDDTLSLTWA